MDSVSRSVQGGDGADNTSSDRGADDSNAAAADVTAALAARLEFGRTSNNGALLVGACSLETNTATTIDSSLTPSLQTTVDGKGNDSVNSSRKDTSDNTSQTQLLHTQPEPEQLHAPSKPRAASCRLPSGQEIDAKNTLRSNSVLHAVGRRDGGATGGGGNTRQAVNDGNFYKQMHGNVHQQSVREVQLPKVRQREGERQPQPHPRHAAAIPSSVALQKDNAASISSLTMPPPVLVRDRSVIAVATTVLQPDGNDNPVLQKQTQRRVQAAPLVRNLNPNHLPSQQRPPVLVPALAVPNPSVERVEPNYGMAESLPIQTIPPDATRVPIQRSPKTPHKRNGIENVKDPSTIEPIDSSSDLSTGPRIVKSRRWILLAIVLVAVVSGVVIGSVCGSSSGTCSSKRSIRTDNPTQSQDAARDAKVATYINSITLAGRNIAVVPLQDRSTLERAEERALQWLLYNDPLQLQPNSSHQQFRIQQRYALQTLLVQIQRNDNNATNSTNSNELLDSFSLEADECNWRGVACQVQDDVLGEARNVVTALNLSSMNLGGTLSADLGLLTAMVRFNVSHNRLSGSLPESLFRYWTRLESIDIGYNRDITGSIAASLGQNWTKLRIFMAPANAFTGPLPTEIGQNWPNLETFSASDNNLRGSLQSSLAKWTNLVHFNVSSNALTSTIPSALSQWTKLEYFNAGGNALLGSLPDGIGDWRNIKVFDVSGRDNADRTWNQLTGSLPDTLRQWTLLEEFSVHDNYLLSGPLSEELGRGWTNLRVFKGSRNGFVGSLSEAMAQWTELEEFDIAQNQLTGTLPPTFEQWSNLRYFDVSFNQISGGFPQQFGQWKSLEHFDISFNSMLGSLPASIGNWTRLRFFLVSDNAFTGTLPESVGLWTNLTEMFNVDRTRLRGTLPSSIGQWSMLKMFSVSVNAFSGKIPTSLNWTRIESAYFQTTNLTGSIPAGLCSIISASSAIMLVADCLEEVTCECCTVCI